VNGSRELVDKIRNIIPEVRFDESWGLDHGAWSILKHIYPNADIPVVQLSIDIHKAPNEHYNIAKKLQTLRNNGFLIIGSGNIVHNLPMITRGNIQYNWAAEFNDAIKNAIITNNFDAIINYNQLPGAKESVPTQEHFIPLIYILGLCTDVDMVSIFVDGIELGSISMTSVFIKGE